MRGFFNNPINDKHFPLLNFRTILFFGNDVRTQLQQRNENRIRQNVS